MAVPTSPRTFTSNYSVPNVIDLRWEAPTSADQTGYILYFGSEAATPYDPDNPFLGVYTGSLLISKTGTDAVTYQFTGSELTYEAVPYGALADGETVYFKVTAINGDGESVDVLPNPDNIKTGVTMDVPYVCTDVEVVSGTTSLIFSWIDPVFDGGSEVLYYNIYTGTTEGTIALTGTAESIANDYSITGLAGGVTRFFQVSAVNAIGEGELSTALSGRTLIVPGTPTGLTDVDGNTIVTLSWTPPEEPGEPLTTHYNIYRGVETGVLTLIGTVIRTETTYSDTGLTNGTTYFYAVSAVNTTGEGELTSEITATPEAAGVNQVSNRNLTACGAINMSVFELTNGHSWTLDIPSNKTVFGIIANFTTNSNLSGTESILISTEDMMVKVYDGDTESIDLFDVTAVVYYK